MPPQSVHVLMGMPIHWPVFSECESIKAVQIGAHAQGCVSDNSCHTNDLCPLPHVGSVVLWTLCRFSGTVCVPLVVRQHFIENGVIQCHSYVQCRRIEYIK